MVQIELEANQDKFREACGGFSSNGPWGWAWDDLDAGHWKAPWFTHGAEALRAMQLIRRINASGSMALVSVADRSFPSPCT
ncbi:hypothetical protein AXG93_2381s1120 [Marchantia polymorpha subsp. ruderalis]|uniref:Uncharacterized protein n=1 Tax=Marchantia polymorpha subsp. ruderalis TaxID=1480154 RepID=A0A176VRD1_MARPO|nr:hypothetical protein AXG93_2381s1120 [Marchantia polymorpha subsp. ruderalis]